MGEKDITEKILEDHNDVFADIINALVFAGEQKILAESLENTAVHSQYKADDEKVHELERDIAKYWKDGEVELLNVMTGDKRYEKIFQKKKGVRSMCDVAERLEKMGIAKGIEIGRLEGKEEGKVEGKAEGKAEGILEGKMQVYRNLLKKGFTEKEAREITEIS